MSKVVVVTGASGGLGRALMQEFASHGWRVVGTGRSESPAGLPDDTEYQQFDAGDAAACEDFWQQFVGVYTDMEVCLVNNAGGYVSGALTDAMPEDYEQMMRSCYFSSVYMTHGLAMTIPKARIINVVSSTALAPHKNTTAYGAAKAAQMHFFQSLQQELDQSKYQITNLYPDNIVSQPPAPNAMDPKDLAAFICTQAENNTSYYLRDVTIWHRDER